MVIESGELSIGVPVDKVLEVIYLRPADLVSLPAAHAEKNEYCKGVVRYGASMVSILDMQKILAKAALRLRKKREWNAEWGMRSAEWIAAARRAPVLIPKSAFEMNSRGGAKMFKNMKLRYRFLLGYSVPILLFFIVAAVVYVNAKDISLQSELARIRARQS